MIVCFTGHRPDGKPEKDKLGTGYSISNERVQAYSGMLRHTLIDLIMKEGAHTFISGGAIGIDQIAFWTVEQLKRDFPTIHNIVAVPFRNQYSVWRNKEIVDWYHKMLSRANSVVFVDEYGQRENSRYASVGQIGVADRSNVKQKMDKRNEYMVDCSNTVIAVWNGTAGGTGNCVKYAEQQGKRIIRLNPIKF